MLKRTAVKGSSAQAPPKKPPPSNEGSSGGAGGSVGVPRDPEDEMVFQIVVEYLTYKEMSQSALQTLQTEWTKS